LELTGFLEFTQDPKIKLWSYLNAILMILKAVVPGKNNFVATFYYCYEV
jgi:hypothetical protein